MVRLSLPKQLLLLSGIPLLASLAFAGLLAARSFATWDNVTHIVALERLISAAEEYTRAIPSEAILSLEWQQTGAAGSGARWPGALIPTARARSDAAIAAVRAQAKAAALTDPVALANVAAAVGLDLSANRARVDAGTETLAHILVTMRPATMQMIALIGRLATLSTDAEMSRRMLAYNAALSMNDAMLVERNVRPIAGPDGRLIASAASGEATGVAQQELLVDQLERLAAPETLSAWHAFLADPATRQVEELRTTVLGLGGGRLDPTSIVVWTEATEQRQQAMAPVLAISSAELHRRVDALESEARLQVAGYSAFILVAFGLVLLLIRTVHRHLAGRIGRLSFTMGRLAAGDLTTAMPEAGPVDTLREMTLTLAMFKVSLIERARLEQAQAAASAALLDEKERLRVTLHAIGDGMIVTGADGLVTMMNGAAETLTGWRTDDALGRAIDQVLHLTNAETGARIDLAPRQADPDAAVTDSVDCTLRRPDGSECAIDASAARIFGRDSSLIGSITVLHDVTESRMLLNRVRQLAQYDTLTGLPNRVLFTDRLSQAVLEAERNGRRCALLFLDMDRFKHVNDTLGHAVGDLLLREVAQCLRLTVRDNDTVARLGGDEFVVILNDLSHAADATRVADQILKLVAGIERIGEHPIDVSFSIGIAIYPQDAHDVNELLKRADAAMYQAKDAGRNAAVFFNKDADSTARLRNQTRVRLARAVQLDMDQFRLLYQPKFHLRTRRVTGAEALIRWYPDQSEMVPPGSFIPLAEETGLILPIGDWVVNEACRQLRRWADQGLPALPVSINLTMANLRNPNLVTTLRRALETSGIDAALLEIEITESAAMADPERILAVLADIRSLGLRVSIDDFGTGFSSLSHLHRLPIDTIKIDREFISRLTRSDGDTALVRGMIGMAVSMRKHVVAEGVETEEQRLLLLEFGCFEAQGFLFSRPITPEALAKMLSRSTKSVTALAEEF